MTSHVFATPDATQTGFLHWLQYVNGLTDVGQGGVIGIFILVAIGAPIFLMMKSYKTEAALVVSSMIMSMVAFYLTTLQLVSSYVFYVTIVLFVIGIFYMMREASNYQS